MAEDSVGYPRPELPARRNFFGWIALASIFAVLIGIQAASYFTRSPAEPLRGVEAQIKEAFSLRSAEGAAGSEQSLKGIAASLEDQRKTSDDAERIWVILTYETHGPLSSTDLQRLRKSKLKDGPALAAVYEHGKLTPDLARSLGKPLESDKRTSTRLARMHANEKAGLPVDKRTLGGAGALVAVVALMAILEGLVLWAIFLAVKVSGAFPAAGHPAEPLTVPQADAFAMRAAQVLGCFIIVPLFISLLTPRSMRTAAQFFAEVGLLVAVFLLRKVPVDGEIISLRRIGFRSERPMRDVLFGVGAGLMNFPLVLALGYAGKFLFRGLPEPEHPIEIQLLGPLSLWTILSVLFAGSVVAPLFEETLFRGTMLPAFSKVCKSPVTGSILTSILFATIHPTGIPAWPGLAAIGGMSCVLAYHTRSLVPSIVMHGVHNALTLAFAMALSG